MSSTNLAQEVQDGGWLDKNAAMLADFRHVSVANRPPPLPLHVMYETVVRRVTRVKTRISEILENRGEQRVTPIDGKDSLISSWRSGKPRGDSPHSNVVEQNTRQSSLWENGYRPVSVNETTRREIP